MNPKSLPIVVLVDDDHAFLLSLAAGLDVLTEEVEFRVATGGRQAAALLRDRPVAVLVTDLNMPEMDGWAVLEIALTARPQPAAIVITADFSTDTGERLARFQPVAVIEKPVDLHQLIMLIRSALRGPVAPDGCEDSDAEQPRTRCVTRRISAALERCVSQLEHVLRNARHPASASAASPAGATIGPRRHQW